MSRVIIGLQGGGAMTCDLRPEILQRSILTSTSILLLLIQSNSPCTYPYRYVHVLISSRAMTAVSDRYYPADSILILQARNRTHVLFQDARRSSLVRTSSLDTPAFTQTPVEREGKRQRQLLQLQQKQRTANLAREQTRQAASLLQGSWVTLWYVGLLLCRLLYA